MRHSLALTAAVLALAWAAPASAQMCGSGQTTGSTASAPATGGAMMCGMGARPSAATDPMSETRAPSQQSAQGGCPCCRMMAMMGGGSGGGMGGMMGGSGSSSQAPAQQPSTPPSGSMPGMPGMTPRQ
jgi:hypothetical protein